MAQMANLQPSDWFREKQQQWQEELQAWHTKHLEFKDPSSKKVAAVTTMSKAKPKGPPPGLAAKASPAEKPKENGKVDAEDDANKDPMQLMEEEIEREEGLDIVFSVEDVCDVNDGNSTPLFSNFAFEDWALLSLRFELHLLLHAVKRDIIKDSSIRGLTPQEVATYYTKFYKKSLMPNYYGRDSIEGVLQLVQDTAIFALRSKQIEPMVTDALASNDVFVRLTEDSRRDRKRRVDSGEVHAVLKFPRPAFAALHATAPRGSVEGSNVVAQPQPGVIGNNVVPNGAAVGKSAVMAQSPQAVSVGKSGGLPGLGVMPGLPFMAQSPQNVSVGKSGVMTQPPPLSSLGVMSQPPPMKSPPAMTPPVLAAAQAPPAKSFSKASFSKGGGPPPAGGSPAAAPDATMGLSKAPAENSKSSQPAFSMPGPDLGMVGKAGGGAAGMLGAVGKGGVVPPSMTPPGMPGAVGKAGVVPSNMTPPGMPGAVGKAGVVPPSMTPPGMPGVVPKGGAKPFGMPGMMGFGKAKANAW